MAEPQPGHDARRGDRDDEGVVEDIAEVFNARDVIDDPNHLEPDDEPASPASDAEAPAPPG